MQFSLTRNSVQADKRPKNKRRSELLELLRPLVRSVVDVIRIKIS